MDMMIFVNRYLAGGLILIAAAIAQGGVSSTAAAATRDYRYAVGQNDRVKALRGGTLPTFIATGTLEENILQAVASHYGVTLTIHCEDPSANTAPLQIDVRNATVAQAVDAARAKAHTYVYRDGANRPVDTLPAAPEAYAAAFDSRAAKADQRITSVDAFPPGCGTLGSAARRFIGDPTHLAADRQAQPLSVDEVAAVLAKEGPFSRSRAMKRLMESNDPAALRLAMRALDDPNPRVMLDAGRTLVALGRKNQAEAQAAQALAERFQRDPYFDLVMLVAPLDPSSAWPMIRELSEATDKTANVVAIRALALSLDPRGIPWLMTVVQSGEQGDAQQAVAIIGKIGGPAAIAALSELLATTDSEERRSLVLEGIALLPEADRAKLHGAVASMIAAGNSSLEMNEALVRRNYLEPLKALLADPNATAEAKLQALTAMGSHGSDTVADNMAPALNDPRPVVRRAAVGAMGLMLTEGAVPYLKTATRDADPEVRAMAAKTLGEYYDDPEIVASLAALLRDPNETVRKSAIDAMDRLGKPSDEMVQAYKSARNSSDPYVARRASELLKYWRIEG